MPSSTASKRFLQVYDCLPADAQHLLVQKHLAPLLDTVSKDSQKRATSSAVEMQRRYAHMPPLNLKAKKAEITTLLLELSFDSKRSLIKERSRREQLLSEAFDSLAQWLNDIWRVVFEFRTNFKLAHTCLLFASEALDQIGNASGGCKCSYVSMFIPVKITRSTGKVVKSFALNGAQNLENVLLWIWRDLFMAILATGSKRQRGTLPDMIDDIRALLGWCALERLLRGGSKSFLEEDSEDEELEEHAAHDPCLHAPDDDDDQSYVSDSRSTICDEELYPQSFYAAHWSWHIIDQQSRLRDLVHTALLNIFKVAPSGPLYTTMMSIAKDGDDLEEELHPLLMSVAGHSSDNLSAALRILSLDNRPDSLDKLLKAHKHLLRSQDTVPLQYAVLVLSANPFYRTHAISIVEEELTDVSNVFHAAISLSFCNINSDINRSELKQILALRRDSLNRRTRIERWVKGVLTPQVETTHPMALAALMIGLPLPPGLEGHDEGDMLGYFDVDEDDPEAEDLREEFRPNIKARLQGWADTAAAVEGGPALLLKIYARVIGDMPFLSGKDVVEEMSARLADRPSKSHVCDALEAFRDFCNTQNKKMASARARTKGTASASPLLVPGQGSEPTPAIVTGVD